MFEKAIKIIIVILAIYILIQIPFIRNIYDNIKEDILDKRDNVTEEYDRVKDKVDDITDKAKEAKDKVDDTVDAVGDVVDTVSDTADKIGDLVGGDDDEDDEDKEGEEGEEEPIAGEICTDKEKAVGICPDNYAPVCGDDGATYGNACEACASGNINTFTPGECPVEDDVTRMSN